MTAAASHRVPAVAGTFYAREARALKAQVAECFEPPRGPGPLGPVDGKRGPRRLVAAMVPHAGLIYSGPIAAHLYRELADQAVPPTVLILGVNHHGLGSPLALSEETWRTPLGEVESDLDLVRALEGGPIVRDSAAHRHEHSIEVQLPFLQTIYPAGSFKLVALQVSFLPLGELREAGRRVAKALKGRDVLALSSSDLSHYLPLAETRHLDRLALDALGTLDPQTLCDTVVERDISMCGIAPTTVLLEAVAGRRLRAQIVAVGTSADAEPMDRVVGYASVAFRAQDD